MRLRVVASCVLACTVLASCFETSGETSAMSSGGSDGPGMANRPPTITGSPPKSAKIGSAYRFEPSASDPDGDPLSFEIVNRPEWASFDTSTGTIWGEPQQGHEGIYSDIRITVTDGVTPASLQPFSITVIQNALGSVTLSLSAPLLNTDGSPLTDLAGFAVHYGRQSGYYAESLEVRNPGITTIVVEDLAPGTYYFSATAFNSKGVSSGFSNEVMRTVD